MSLPDQILDIVLKLAVGGLAHGVSDRRTALDLVNQDAIRRIVGVTASGLVPSTTRLALLLLKHCTMAAAAGNGRMDILTLRLSFDLLYESVDDLHPIVEATRGGHFNVLEFLQHGPNAPYRQIDTQDIAQAMGAASLAGREEMLVYWRQQEHCPLNSLDTQDEFFTKYFLYSAIDGGSIPVLEWWAAQLSHEHLVDPKYPIRMAAQRQQEALSWWYATRAQGTPAESPYTWTAEQLNDFGTTATSALFRAQLHPSQKPNAAADPISTLQDGLIMRLLTTAGRADDLDWWTDVRGAELPAFSLLCPEWNCSSTPSALDWWWERVPDLDAFSLAATAAVLLDRTDMLDWAHSHGIMKQKSFNLIWHISNAVAKGHVASLTWFYTHQYPMSITPTMLQEASRNGHVQVLDWLARTLPVPFPWMGAGVVESACASGHTHVLDWWIAAARDPTLPPGRVPLEYWALALDRATTIQVLDWWLFGNHGLPLKYTSDCVSLISHWKNGATDAMDLWAASGHPMLYGHQYMEKIAMKSQVQLLEWLRANGYALKVRREWYDRLYLQLRLLNGEVVVEDGKELVWNQRWNEFSEAVLRWWEEHIFREGGNDQLEILEPFAPSPLLIRSIPSQPTPPLPRTFLSRLGDLFKF